ncbi:V-type ATP synthase subunit F [Clostridium polyendosporum]|uniref:V-type ATP synthase subunit F n=1 Tax=Clostridium polyendosporum TaxID=69208 RepID=A0A919RW74_9CLOT|nr:V-type ATP synthase subunit F [Clostridium polyendosporum]GIM27459.1 V-type ATP synthase subunit F [Clostridium polyendosporum]
MRSFLISDNLDSFIGMRMAGIDGIVLHDKEEILEKLNELTQREDLGIILITEKAASLLPEKIKKMKLKKGTPLIIEIPDRHGFFKDRDYIEGYVKEAVGLKI